MKSWYYALSVAVGLVIAFALIVWPAQAVMPRDWCSFPSWCPWSTWDICWAYADCNFSDGTTGGGSEPDPCEQCKKKCQDEYNQNLKSCDGSPHCSDLALSEFEACITLCAIDFCA